MAKVEGAPAHGAVAHLLPQTYKRLVSEWLEEDTPSFDYGGFVVGEEMSEAKLLGKSEVSVFSLFKYQLTLAGHSSWCPVLR
jgi:nicotinate-nucleotide pyrophosphorylase (carboxylating)